MLNRTWYHHAPRLLLTSQSFQFSLAQPSPAYSVESQKINTNFSLLHRSRLISPCTQHLSGVSLLGEWEARSKFLDGELREPLAHIDALGEGLAGDETGLETAGESVTVVIVSMRIMGIFFGYAKKEEDSPSTVGVVDLGLLDSVNGVGRDLDGAVLLCDGGDGGVSALRDDDGARLGSVLLGEFGDQFGDLGDILGLVTVGLCEGESLGLIADDVVGEWRDGVELIFEELRDERSGEAQGEGLVLGRCLFGDGEDRRDANGQEEAANVVVLGFLDERPDGGLLKVVELVLVRGRKMGAEGAVVAGDDNTAAAGGNGLVDAVFGVQTGFLAGFGKDVGVLVLTDATDVHDGVGGKDVLSVQRRVSLVESRSRSRTWSSRRT